MERVADLVPPVNAGGPPPALPPSLRPAVHRLARMMMRPGDRPAAVRRVAEDAAAGVWDRSLWLSLEDFLHAAGPAVRAAVAEWRRSPKTVQIRAVVCY